MPADRVTILLAKEAAEIAYDRVSKLRESLDGSDPRESLVSRGEVTRIKALESALDEGTADLLTLLISYDDRIAAPESGRRNHRLDRDSRPERCTLCEVRPREPKRLVCRVCRRKQNAERSAPRTEPTSRQQKG